MPDAAKPKRLVWKRDDVDLPFGGGTRFAELEEPVRASDGHNASRAAYWWHWKLGRWVASLATIEGPVGELVECASRREAQAAAERLAQSTAPAEDLEALAEQDFGPVAFHGDV
jgi:hypothetical protein